MDKDIEKLKLLTINMLQETQNNDMEHKQQLKNLVISILLTLLPILIFMLIPSMGNKYFDMFSGRIMYISSDHFFSFSPIFVLNLLYFLPPIIWIFSIWFCLKIRRGIQDRKSFFNYFNLILIVLGSVELLYSLWFLYRYYLL
ncbi:MAG: hypothetical protein K9L98_02070 [Candidatus Pacebacteria bacterium]|nr:hypothetical protein [Candidatus Paceibacterota bacterium]MCF7862773.1 hypothetical protein [Candidatus Paceibacterota bacterium]